MAEWTEPPVLSVNATSVSLALITGVNHDNLSCVQFP